MWILPTRGRPESLRRFATHYDMTGAKDRVYLRFDDDDPALDEYKMIRLWPASFKVRIGPRARMPKALNEALERYPNENCYGILGDDVVPRTANWDKMLADAAGPWGVAYGRDGQNDERHGTHPLMGGELARAWGRLALDGLVHLYNDTVWMELGRALGVIKYVPEVYMEHLHYTTGKSPFDEIYNREINGENYAYTDEQIFRAWKDSVLPGLTERLRDAIDAAGAL